MTLVRNGFVITATLITIAACSSKGGSKNGSGTDQNATEGSDTSDAPLTADEKLCDEHYKSQLAWVARCGGFLSDSPSAIGRYRKICVRELVAPGAEGLRDARQKCIASRAAAACNDPVKDCDMPPGALADGAACGVRAQCQSRFCKVDGSGCGTCAALVAAGGECTAPTDCAFGANEIAGCQFTDSKSTTGKCTIWKLASVGAACGTDSFCAPGGHCESDSQDGPGTCVPDADKGGACVDSTSCRLPFVCIDKKCADRVGEGEACTTYDSCADGLACAQTCQKPMFVNSGQECGASRHCERGICFQQGQQGENGQMVPVGAPTCVAPIADGDPCGPNDQGLTCDFFARCVGGKCVFSDPTQCK